jgi:hypothetical protein
MLSLNRMLVDGTLLSLGLGVLVLGSLYYNPRLWLQDYPAPIRAKVPPIKPTEKRQQRILMIPLLLLMFSIPLYSTYQSRLENGGSISFITAYVNTFVVSNIFNLFDAVVLDLLILTLMKPKFAVIPGAEGMEYLYRDWNMHLRNYLKGIVVCAVLSLPITLLAML